MFALQFVTSLHNATCYKLAIVFRNHKVQNPILSLEASYSDCSTYSTLQQTAIQFFLCPSQSLSLNIPFDAKQVLLVRSLLNKLKNILILSPYILDIPAVNSFKRPIWS